MNACLIEYNRNTPTVLNFLLSLKHFRPDFDFFSYRQTVSSNIGIQYNIYKKTFYNCNCSYERGLPKAYYESNTYRCVKYCEHN